MILDADYSILSKLLFSELIWVPFPETGKCHQLSLIFKCINTIVPTYLHNMFRPKSNDHTFLLRSSGNGQLDVSRQHTRSLSLIGPKLWNNLNKCPHQNELSHFHHLYNILAFKFKMSLFCNYVMYIFMYVSNIMSTLCIYDFFSEGPMADERKLNGSLSINKEYYYYYYYIITDKVNTHSLIVVSVITQKKLTWFQSIQPAVLY